MRLKIKPERGFGKIEVEINEDLWKKIEDLSERYKVGEDYILRIILTGEFKTPNEDVQNLEKKVQELEKKVYELEKKWAPLRYKAYGVSEDNKILAIELSGLLAENTQLKRFLRKKVEPNFELRKLIEYYIR
ncbi:hypothetical protein [Thermococcus barophilus]|uniref:Uncharacterized protein n=1 Tax=Thermococcus barophilus (strain DSM 11836 / MP) TaxID=391623 RepID=F0LMM9_THEBM|nr:hypothetical protein [Thermococcus barophilus]ADT84008.1 hypothetical protein TERMP_01032 [Thermococcus barophilus MP]